MTDESNTEVDVITLGPEFFVTRMDDLFNWSRPIPAAKDAVEDKVPD